VSDAISKLQRYDLVDKYDLVMSTTDMGDYVRYDDVVEALQSGEPVAVADRGVLNWIDGKQFNREADLYTTPQPVVPDETMVAALCEIAKWIEDNIGHKNHPVSFIERKALL
jgi:hypothetical protein